MTKLCHIILLFLVILKALCQDEIGDPCTLPESPGVCKLLSDCTRVRDEVITHLHLPQVCGFQDTQSIVCCPIDGKRKRGVISKTKCREYSKYAYRKPPWESGVQSECGHKIVKRIVGGVPTGRTEFAHMAAIGFEPKSGQINWAGGGSLISEQYVLTSARFKTTPSMGEAKHVKLGVTSLTDIDHQQEFKIAEFIIHPDFVHQKVYNDIGLIKLDKPVTLYSYARPACLYTGDTISEEKGIAIGWGTTSFAGQPSDQLIKVSLDFVDHDFCNKSYSSVISKRMPHGIDKEGHICAGTGVENKDTCQGDSGGPLQIYHIDDDIKCMYDIVGITSFGKACFGGPGVYVKVSHYITWIENIVWPEQSG